MVVKHTVPDGGPLDNGYKWHSTRWRSNYYSILEGISILVSELIRLKFTELILKIIFPQHGNNSVQLIYYIHALCEVVCTCKQKYE